MNMKNHPSKVSSVPLWLVVWLLLLGILLQGHYAFKVVGNLGQPTWDYDIVKDVPGQSPYAMYELLPYPQHVMGREGR
jgi:hypothetical protein